MTPLEIPQQVRPIIPVKLVQPTVIGDIQQRSYYTSGMKGKKFKECCEASPGKYRLKTYEYVNEYKFNEHHPASPCAAGDTGENLSRIP